MKEVRQGSHEGPTRVEGAPRGGGRAPCLVPSSLLPLRTLQVFWIASVPKITLLKVSFRLIFLFFETLKQVKKQELALGSGLIG